MAFTWSNLKVGDMSKKSDIDEIRQNIENLFNQLGRGYQWKYDENAVKGNMYEYDRIKELRDALDYLDSIKCNDCSAFNSFELVAAYPLANDGYDSVDCYGHNSTVHTGDDNSANSGYDSGNKNPHFANQDTSNNSTDDYAYDNKDLAIDDNGHDSSVDGTVDNTVRDGHLILAENYDGGCSGDDSGYDGTYHFNARNPHCDGYLATDLGTYE